MNCPVCLSNDFSLVKSDIYPNKTYYNCSSCDLIYLDPLKRLGPEQEKSRYENHQNSRSDKGYIQHLNQLVFPLIPYLPQNAVGLDFGSGPNPVLAEMLSNFGCEMQIYDTFFFPEQSALERKYDFITASEVIEHLYRPDHEIDKIYKLLKPGGVFGVMTKFHEGPLHFSNWYYHRDETHVAFYSQSTFEHIALKWNMKILYKSNPVVIFKKED